MTEALTQILNQPIQTTGEHPFTPLEVVCLRNSTNALNLVSLLLENGADPNATGSYPLMIAAQAFKNASVQEEVSKTALENGARIIMKLLEAGANPFRIIQNRFRLTAFQFMLGMDLPVQISQYCIAKLVSGDFAVETDVHSLD